MADEIGELPKISHRLTNSDTFSAIQPHQLVEQRSNFLANDILNRLQSGVNREVAQIKKSFLSEADPNNEEEQAQIETEVETVCDIVFGPLRLERSTLLEQGQPSETEKEASARIQHSITHAAYFAGLPEADLDFAKSVYESIKLGKKLAFLPGQFNLVTQLPSRWSGIQNEIAVVKALKRGGYEVFLPDYNQDTYALQSQDDNEVLQLDVRSGIDMVAVKDGTTFLIDSKGRKDLFNPTQNNLDRRAIAPVKVSLDSLRNKCVKNVLEDISGQVPINPNAVYRTIIMIPSAQGNFRTLELPDSPSDVKAHLSQFGRLDESVEKPILWRLSHLEHSSQFLSAYDKVRAEQVRTSHVA